MYDIDSGIFVLFKAITRLIAPKNTQRTAMVGQVFSQNYVPNVRNLQNYRHT